MRRAPLLGLALALGLSAAPLGAAGPATTGPLPASSALAVLPFTRGPGTDAYDGLGLSLAGLVAADLDEVPGLVLVERARLDEVLAEQKLSATGAVDPDVALRVGRLLAARYLVTGTFGVVKEQLVLTAAVVDAQTGQKREVAAQGTIEDFISVEKALVEALIGKLPVELPGPARRRILASAPTESFRAFSAYSAGLAEESRGRLEAARRAYDRALQVDPAFLDARRAKAALLLRIEEGRAVDVRGEQTRRRRALEAALAQAPKASGASPTFAQAVDVTVRWMLLAALDRHCQRAQEMRAWLEEAGGRVALPSPPGPTSSPPSPRGRSPFAIAVEARIQALGLYARQPGTGPQDVVVLESTRGSGVLRGPRPFLLDLDGSTGADLAPGQGLWTSLARCHGVSEGVRLLQDAADLVDRAGGLDLVVDKDNYPEVTLRHELLALRARVQARDEGTTTRVTAAAQDLLDRLQGTPSGRFWSRLRADVILRDAEATDRVYLARLGWSDDEAQGVARAIRAAARALPDASSPDAPACERALRDGDRSLHFALLERERAGHFSALYARAVGPVVALGCLGEPGRFPSLEAAVAFVESSPRRARPDRKDDARCQEHQGKLVGLLAPVKDGAVPEARLRHLAVDLLQLYYGSLVAERCVDDEEVMARLRERASAGEAKGR